MILQDKDIEPLKDADGLYDCQIMNDRRFGLFFLPASSRYPFGNIVSFVSTCKIGPSIVNAVVFMYDVELTNLFGGICFQRLFMTYVGQVLEEYTKSPFRMDGGCILGEDDAQVSVGVNFQQKNSILFHDFIVLEETPLFKASGLKEDSIAQFQTSCIDCFKFLTRDVYIQSAR